MSDFRKDTEIEDILIVADMTCPYQNEKERNAYLAGVEKGLSEGLGLGIKYCKEVVNG